MHRILMLAQAVLLVGTTGELALSQQTNGQLAVVGGTATDVAGITSNAVTVAPSLSITPDPRLNIAVGASGTRFDNQQWSLGGAAGIAARAPLAARAAVTLNGSAGATATSYNLSYVTADLVPAFETSVASLTFYGGAHFAYAATSGLQQPLSSAGPLPSPRPSVSSSASSRDAVGALGGVTAKFTATSGESVVLGYREEHATIAGIPTVDRAGTVSIGQGGLVLGGAVGERHETSGNTTFANASLSVGITHAVALQFAAGSYAANRLVGTPAGHFVNAGIALRLGSRAVPPAEPEDVRPAASGMTRLALRAADAQRVEVAGDFTNWQPIAARRAANGVWYVDLRVPPGRYRYAFRVDGKDWRVPDGATVVDDDFGGKSAWLTVEANAR